MRKLMIGLAFGASVLTAASASAQTCLGNASFSPTPMRIGAGLQVPSGAKVYGLNFAAGSQSGLFGDASLNHASPDGGGDGATMFGLGAGYAMDFTPDHKIQFCPRVGYQHQSGPDDFGANSFTLGGNFGTSVVASPTLDFVPFAGLTYIDTRYEGLSDSYGNLGIGAGFVLKKQWTIQPQLIFPLGEEGADTYFQIGVGYSFGHSSAAAPARRPGRR